MKNIKKPSETKSGQFSFWEHLNQYSKLASIGKFLKRKSITGPIAGAGLGNQ